MQYISTLITDSALTECIASHGTPIATVHLVIPTLCDLLIVLHVRAALVST